MIGYVSYEKHDIDIDIEHVIHQAIHTSKNQNKFLYVLY